MDYEKAYKEALERAKTSYENSHGMILTKWLEGIFPELAESEDERIRKELIRFHKSTVDIDGIKGKDIIAWLEKQKPIEEVNGEDYGIDGLWHAERILEKTLGEVEGYQTDDGILEHKAAITAVRNLHSSKPVEWSEEDEEWFNFTMDYLDNGQQEWLKSLKERLK